MPPRASLTSSFSVTDANNEVVCPLRNQDSSACRKRCLGEKRYRSMQEHIRRAHPEYYLPKLPATKDSFELMINSPPHERPAQDPNHANHHRPYSSGSQHQQPPPHVQHSDPSGLSPAFLLDGGLSSSFEGYHGFGQHDGGYYTAGDAEAQAIYHHMHAQQRSSDEYRRGSLIPAASAAAALAQLHYHRPDSDWGGDGMGQVILPSLEMSPTNTEADFLQNYYADQNNDMKTNSFNVDPALEDTSFMQDHHGLPMSSHSDQQSLLPSSLARSPPDRTSSLPSLQRSLSAQYRRQRKSSLSQQARMAKHERRKSREYSKRNSGDRKAFSSEPSTSAAMIYGKRWEDLIDAAQSATEEEGSRDLTPVQEPASPFQSPQVASRTSLPPFAMGSQFQSFQASPLNRALTPPPPDTGLDLQPFASVESSLSSNLSHQHHTSADSTGSQFHIMNPNSLTTPSDTSPLFNPANPAPDSAHPSSGPVQIYCAGCRRLNVLKEAYACTSCICGLCSECVHAIINGQSRGRMSMCPRCNAMDSNFKPFQLDFR